MAKIIQIFILNLFLIFGEFCTNDCLAETNKKYVRYLTHIFTKYGNGTAISFEGFEHLMHNLGIGGLEFSPTHTIEEHHPKDFKIPDLNVEEDNEENPNEQIKKNLTGLLKEILQKKDKKDDLIESDEFQLRTNEVDFKDMHDPKHRHPRHQEEEHDHKKPTNICLSPRGVLKMVIDENEISGSSQSQLMYKTERGLSSSTKKKKDNNVDNSGEEELNEFLTSLKIKPSTFLKLCPVLLVQMDQQLCTENHLQLKIDEDDEHTKNSHSFLYACVAASISIFILSSCGLFGILIVPLMKSYAYQEILKFLVAIAIGTLGGDALMHLLPHALAQAEINKNSNEHDHSGPVLICGCAFLAVIFMYCIETLLPLLRGDSGGHGHSHGGHDHHKQNNQQNDDGKLGGHGHNHSGHLSKITENKNPNEINRMLNENKPDIKGKNAPMAPVAFMVIIGDGLHNLTDGLAIGAAFAADPITGMATAFAVLCHELPHELGDFALLIQTGMSIRRAVYLNIVSSVLSFIGMAFGLAIAGLHGSMVKWIYACTSGSFLYIALADLVPELGKSGEKSVMNSLIQIIGILLGGLIMLLIALNESSLRSLFE